MSLTAAQQQAVAARGNVLVMAGAGTGKTRALVERCLDCLLHDSSRISLDQILVVTFTEAAAAEMRQRIRARLERAAADHPGEAHWQEQLAIFETAHIGTLHSFCLRLVRQHFYQLELDPQLTVLPEEEARLLAEETLQGLLQSCYEGKGPDAAAVEQLILSYGKGSDGPIRSLALRLHHYAQSLPSPESWFDQQLRFFSEPRPESWKKWHRQAVKDWIKRSRQLCEKLAPGNEVAAECLRGLPADPGAVPAQDVSDVLGAFEQAAENCPRNRRRAWLGPLRSLLEEASFLKTLAGSEASGDPLQEDWNWVRSSMSALLNLTRKFGADFSRAKKELGSVDFHDLEQHTLRLLWDSENGRPTATALLWRDRLRHVMVDEYQDINAAQDQILTALSHEGTRANRFLVGDVKQSIYRFRLANPRIFQTYAATWRGDHARTIALVENFRSRESILRFVNLVFESTMRRSLGGVEYDEEARLAFGGANERQPFAAGADVVPSVELHLRLGGPDENSEGETETAVGLEAVGELEEAAKEARLVGLRLCQVRADRHPVWDEVAGRFRPADWRDMAVLLRAPAGKSESFAKEFARLGIPLQVERGGFYSSSEVSDLLSLLQALDNPLQDVPLLAVLRSPIVALSLDELAVIRLAALKAPFWTALNRFSSQGAEARAKPGQAGPSPPIEEAALRQRVSVFLERYGRWRRLARQSSLSHCLETVLAETHYEPWLQLQPRGARRRANVKHLLTVARHFDQLQRQGLFRFLRFIEAQQSAEVEPEVTAESNENAVRLLSIHQSKGLEFPVVVAADLGKRFNLSDNRADIILDEEFGLSPVVAPPHVRKRYPSLAHWLASKRQKRELLGEELRLLYVAMTRARDLLILTGSISQKAQEMNWTGATENLDPADACCCADWLAKALGPWAPIGLQRGQPRAVRLNTSAGDCQLNWAVHGDNGAPAPVSPAIQSDLDSPRLPSPAEWEQARQRLAWRYEFLDSTREPAKTTVTALRRRAAAFDEAAGQLSKFALARPSRLAAGRSSSQPSRRLSGTDIGTAHHAFMQWVDLEKTGSIAMLRQEAERLKTQNILTDDQAKLLHLEAIAGFWQSALGTAIKGQKQFLHRELPFSFRLSPAELAKLSNALPEKADLGPPRTFPVDEFVIVQGVADIAVLLPEEIWLVDFKTDRVGGNGELPAAKYAPQLKLYARALRVIYRRPVTQCWLWFLGSSRGVAIEV